MNLVKSILNKKQNSKCVFTFGRFQPPTYGHGLLINKVKNFNLPYFIFVSKTHDKNKNPLNVDKKLFWLNRIFPDAKFTKADTQTDFLKAAKYISELGYTDLIMVAGSDRVDDYKKKLNKYNNKLFTFNTIEVISAGTRDPDSSEIAGISGSSARQCAKDNDFTSFRRLIPRLDDKSIRELMIDITLSYDDTTLRERFISGNLFKIGQIVEDTSKNKYKIIALGANYLTVINEAGVQSKQWINQMKPTRTKKFAEPIIEDYNYEYIDQIPLVKEGVSKILENYRHTDGIKLLIDSIEAVSKSMCETRDVSCCTKELKLIKENKFGFSVFDDLFEALDAGSENDGDSESASKMKTKKFLDDDFSWDEFGSDEFDLSDDDLDTLAGNVDDDEIFDLYDFDDFALVDDDGNVLDDLNIDDLEEEVINEVLSRAGRIKARANFKRSKAKRLRGAKLALHRRSSGDKLHKKAMRLASITLKRKLVKKSLSSLSVAEKERLERMMARKKKLVQRLASKMSNQVRKIENARMTHKSYTK